MPSKTHRLFVPCVVIVSLACLLCWTPVEACFIDVVGEIRIAAGEKAYRRVQCGTGFCDGTLEAMIGDPSIARVIPDSYTNVGDDWVTFEIEGLLAGETYLQIDWSCQIGNDSWTIPIYVDPPNWWEDLIITWFNRLSSATLYHPVNTSNGELFHEGPPDLFLGGPMSLFWRRYYAAYLRRSFVAGPSGLNWRHNYDRRLAWNGSYLQYTDNRGRVTRFLRPAFPGPFIQQDNLDTPYQVFVETGQDPILFDPITELIYTFDYHTGGAATGKLWKVEDGKGNTHTVTFDANGDILELADGLGRTLFVDFDGDWLVGTVTDQGGRSVQYEYDGTFEDSNLIRYWDALNRATEYEYKDTSGTADWALMTRMTLPRGNVPYTQTFYGTAVVLSSGRVETQTDAYGNTHTFEYDPLAGLTMMTDPLGKTKKHTHDASGGLTAWEDEDGNTFTMTSDATGRRASITDRKGNTTFYEYHAESGKLQRIIHADGTITRFEFTPRQHLYGVVFYDLTRIIHADGMEDAFQYDANGNLIRWTDRAGNEWIYTYNGNGQVLTATNPAGGITTFTYNADGTLASRTDHTGNTWTFAYDNLKRLEQITNPDQTTRSFTYDDCDQLLTVTNERDHVTTFAYDANGNLVTVTDPLLNVTTFAYDAMDRLEGVTDATGNVDSRDYNALQRLETYTDRNGNNVTYAYDARGRLVSIMDGGDLIWGRTYDLEGILTSAMDPLLNTTEYTSDQMGRFTQVESPMDYLRAISYDAMGRPLTRTNPLNEVTTFTYGPRGLLLGISLGGKEISVSYARNDLAQIIEVTDPNGNVWERTYDEQGRLTSKQDPLGNQRTYEYDDRNRVSRIDLPESTVDFTYDEAGNLVRGLYSDGLDLTYTYNELNHLINAGGTATFQYDENGRLQSSGSFSVTRTPNGQIETLTLESGKAVAYTYNSRNFLASVTDWLGGVTTFAYDDAGHVVIITRPNGITTTYAYDEDGRLTGIAEGTLSSITLIRDGKGQITQATRDVPLDAEPMLRQGTQNYAYDDACQMVGSNYDAMGRLLSDGTHTCGWDLASRMTSMTTAKGEFLYTYDALGKRLARSEGGVTRNYEWNYLLGLPSVSLEKGDSPFPVIRYYVHTPGGALLYCIEADTNARRFYHYDEMGNTLFLTDDAGVVVAAYAYDPYGIPLDSTGDVENPFTWQGRFGVMQEGDTHFYYNRARYYDSRMGRFLSREPLVRRGPQSVNPYQYGFGDPLMNADPDGRWEFNMSKGAFDDNRINFYAYGTSRYGVNVAGGDVDADGYDEILTGPGPGSVFGPHIRGWNQGGTSGTPGDQVNYYAYGTPKWGVNVAGGDVDADKYDEILTGPGPGSVFGPHVRGWNQVWTSSTPIDQVNFHAYGTLKWGVNVAGGDVDADGYDDIITGSGPGTVFGPHLRGWGYNCFGLPANCTEAVYWKGISMSSGLGFNILQSNSVDWPRINVDVNPFFWISGPDFLSPQGSGFRLEGSFKKDW